MATEGVLARQYVEFVTKGLQQVQQAMATVRAGLANVSAATADMARRLNEAVVSPAAIGAAVAGFQLLTQAARSWVSAGLAGTTHGNMLSAQFSLLSQQIAGVFVPTINMVIRAVEQLTMWFRSLTGEQQSNIRRWVEAAAVMVVVHGLIGKLIGVVAAFVASVVTGMANVAVALAMGTAGLSTILGVIGAVISGFASLGIIGTTVGAGIAVGTETGRSALARLWESIKPIVASIKSVGSALWDAIGPVVEMLGGKVGAMLQRLASAIVETLQRAGPLLQRLAVIADYAGQRLGKMIDGIRFEPIIDGAIKLGTWLIDAFEKSIPHLQQMWDIVKVFANVFYEIGVQVKNLLQTTIDLDTVFLGLKATLISLGIVGVASAGALIQALLPIIVVVGAIGHAFQSLAKLIDEVTARFFESMASLFESLPSTILDMIGITQSQVEAMRALATEFRREFPPLQIPNIPAFQPNQNQARTDVSQAGGRFESAAELYMRINEAAIKNDVAQQQLNTQQQIANNVQQIAANMGPGGGFQQVGPPNYEPDTGPGFVGGGDW